MTGAKPSAGQHITCCRSGRDQARRPPVMEMSPSMSCSSSFRFMEAIPKTWKPRLSEARACFRLFALKMEARATLVRATSTWRSRFFPSLGSSLPPGTQAVRMAAQSECRVIPVQQRLRDLAVELTSARGRVAQMLEAKEEMSLEELRDAHSFADSLHYELQDTILKARMVPVGPLFHQYNRTVRDLAKSLGKMAQLRIEGEDIEVDTSVFEYLKDPLLHMIRNALDHGIEQPAKRKKRGKSQTGTITVRAARESRNIVIEVIDDGAGLDKQKIIEVAQKKGLVAESQKLADQEIHQLIFEPGFTTASQVSNMSGRGVGMDVVRRNIQALRGSVHVTSQPGVGATVRIRLPLTLAIIEGFGVGVGNETYVIPVDQVIECVELGKEDHENARKDGVLQLRSEPLPYIYLQDHFGLPGDRGARQSVVVVQYETGRAGLAVNELYGATQTVIKPLPAIFKDVSGVSGSAILGNGRVALILDIPALFRNYRATEHQ